MPRLLIFQIFFFLISLKSVAQSDIEILKSGMNPSTNYVRYNNTATLGDKSAGSISYSDVDGTPFWDANWNPALLICSEGRAFMLNQAKLNIYSGDVHYTDSTGKEMVATDIIERIIFFKGTDTINGTAVFGKFPSGTASKNNFYQVLNEGNTELLKLFSTKLDSRFDPLAGKAINKFLPRSEYYIAVNGIAKPLKKLDKESVFQHITNIPRVQEWLKANKNSLKNESQITGFLTFYNELVKEEPQLFLHQGI